MILFLANYPDETTIKEGMSQRIMNIDSFYKGEVRVYLSVLLFRNFRKKIEIIDDEITFYQCNTFIHIFTIISLLLKSNKIYIHSLYNVLPSFLYIALSSKKIILDIHGVVPEENKLINKNFRYLIFNFCERMVLSKEKLTVVCVTNHMIDFYKKKYKTTKAQFVRYIIFPNNLDQHKDDELIINETNIINIVYSGNLQKWQNIDLMIEVIKKNYHHSHYHFYILTGELKQMQEKFVKAAFDDMQRVTIDSFPPDKLHFIYSICHYGFILRDDIVVNNVACPTKLIEYMNYGIVPIVLSDNIGDFKEYGYERISVEEMGDLSSYKSLKNIQIIKKIKQENNQIAIKEL